MFPDWHPDCNIRHFSRLSWELIKSRKDLREARKKGAHPAVIAAIEEEVAEAEEALANYLKTGRE